MAGERARHRDRLRADAVPDLAARRAGVACRAQAAFAKEAPNRRLVTAAHSSHGIPVDRPDIVEAQNEAMVTATR
ncbi:hypothetical protein OG896_02955 [Streptomyces sp. NBC_00669]|uniref:hypothetical protein n=1 Tax=Streptomyces sp. NBC_00669 TaxID=2976011 RepID=UPI002E37672A|nr:hypothetical protein [Streptomyces sp. NBC_00669]